MTKKEILRKNLTDTQWSFLAHHFGMLESLEKIMDEYAAQIVRMTDECDNWGTLVSGHENNPITLTEQSLPDNSYIIEQSEDGGINIHLNNTSSPVHIYTFSKPLNT